ncbi:MAG TPA: radical SAM protein [Capsulimonadaceae bacterium]|nr:radical SAM protein [Capsulimonadaceae bacterium]
MIPSQSLFLITPPDPPGQTIHRSHSSGIGVVVPASWKDRIRRQERRGERLLPPMETLYAASVAEDAGAKVTLLDVGLEGWQGDLAVSETLSLLPAAGTDSVLWLGIRLSMPTLLHDLAYAKALKESRSDARLFVHGSPIMTTLDHWVKEAQGVDAIIFGELEEIIGGLLNAPKGKWKKARGVLDPATYTARDAAVLFDKNMVTSFDQWVRVREMGKLPHPAWHLVPFARYSPTGRVQDCGVHVQSSRGCPIGCTMCPYMLHEGRPFRKNPVERVVEELKHLNEVYGITHVSFRDPNFGFDKKHMRELAEMIIGQGVKIEAAAELSLELLDHESIDLLHQAGIRTILTGIETNDEECLQSIGQKIKINEYLEEKIAYCRQIGTNVFASFVVGAPEESWETVQRTINYAKLVDAQCAATIMTPFPGTPMFYRAIEEGLLRPRMRYEEWNSYTATMRSRYLSCRDLTAARLWFRLETIIPYRLREAECAGGKTAVRKERMRLFPHRTVRQALRGYVWFKRRVMPTKAILPNADGSTGAQNARRALWEGHS